MGWVAGQLMAMKNGHRSVWVFSLLDLKPTDRVLEIGFGSGTDIARASQAAAFVAGVDHSEVMLKMAGFAHRETGLRDLCLAGGVALNCVGNGRIQREGPFEQIWIQPAAGDAGPVTEEMRKIIADYAMNGLPADLVEAAKRRDATTVAFTGNGGGPLADLADLILLGPHGYSAIVQEVHIALGHIICDLVEQDLLL